MEPTVGLGAALLIFLMVGAFAAGIAQAFQLVITIFPIKSFNTTDVFTVSDNFCLCLIFSKVRRHVYHDADNLDTAFDAGGKVSIGLTATTIVSQWTWSATLLQSSTVASKVSENILVISGKLYFGLLQI